VVVSLFNTHYQALHFKWYGKLGKPRSQMCYRCVKLMAITVKALWLNAKLHMSVAWCACGLFTFTLQVKEYVKKMHLLYNYIMNKQRHIYQNILSHIVSFFNNMFRYKKSTISRQVTVQMDGFGGLVVSMLATGSRVRGFESDRSRWIFSMWKNPQHAFLRRGSKIICPMSQLWGMSKIQASAVNYGLLAKFSSVSFPR
jgi:hypothetical protein